MPQYVVSKIDRGPTERGPAVIMVFADSEKDAKKQAAKDLKTTPGNLKAVNFDTFDTE